MGLLYISFQVNISLKFNPKPITSWITMRLTVGQTDGYASRETFLCVSLLLQGGQ